MEEITIFKVGNVHHKGKIQVIWSITEAWMGKFKDPVSYVCLACAVVVSWSLTQEMAGSNPFTLIPNSFSYRIQRIQWKHLGKTQLRCFVEIIDWLSFSVTFGIAG